VKRARSGEQSAEDDKAIHDLAGLLDVASSKRSPGKSSGGHRARRRKLDVGASELSDSSDDESASPPRAHISPSHASSATTTATGRKSSRADENNLAIDDAENPLQLLARASDLQLSPKTSNGRTVINNKIPIRTVTSREKLDDVGEAQSFFTSIRVTLDVGDDIDPISLGLVTDDEAEALFSLFVEPPLLTPRLR
jgi:hypothetical protein